MQKGDKNHNLSLTGDQGLEDAVIIAEVLVMEEVSLKNTSSTWI